MNSPFLANTPAASVLALLVIIFSSVGAAASPTRAVLESPSDLPSPHLTQGLTATDLVSEVLQNNPGLESMHRAVDRARSAVRPSGALDDPILSYAVAPASLGLAELDPGHIVGVAQPLPWPGKRRTRREVAKQAARTRQAELAQLRFELVATARERFADWVYLHAAVQANVSQQKLITDLVASSRAHYIGGSVGKHALIAAQLKHTQRERALIDLRVERRVLAAQINALRNVEPNQTLASPASFPNLAVLPDIETLQQVLLQSHPRLQELDARIQGAQAEQRLARLDEMPDLRLTANWIGTLPRDEYRGQIGVILNLPFGQAKREDAQAAAAARVDELRAVRQDMVAKLKADLQSAVMRASAAMETLDLYRSDLLPLAEQNVHTAQAEYAAGTGTVREFIEAEADLLDARLGVAAAERDHYRQYLRISRMTSGSLDEQLFRELTR